MKGVNTRVPSSSTTCPVPQPDHQHTTSLNAAPPRPMSLHSVEDDPPPCATTLARTAPLRNQFGEDGPPARPLWRGRPPCAISLAGTAPLRNHFGEDAPPARPVWQDAPPAHFTLWGTPPLPKALFETWLETYCFRWVFFEERVPSLTAFDNKQLAFDN